MRRRLVRSAALVMLGVVSAVGTASPLAAQSSRSRGGGDTPPRAASDPFEQQRLLKAVNDEILLSRLAPVGIARKVSYRGADGLMVPAYLFAPSDTTVRRPVILLIHGGVHGDFSAGHGLVVASLVRRGYVVVAPEYRGSTGYGRAFYDAIDYGGKEVEDCVDAIDWLAATVPFADTTRVGVFGWSHGGFIAVHAVLRYPQRFRVAVAHVPVADLPTRMRTHPAWYHELFVLQPGFGARVEDNPRPYLQRSLTTHVRELRTPLLVHTADNDEDVFIIENHILRDSMVAAGMDRKGLYTYHEWHNPPGGHSFSVLDTPQGRESWTETTAFLGRYLHPGVRD